MNATRTFWILWIAGSVTAAVIVTHAINRVLDWMDDRWP